MLSGSESCGQDSCSAERPERCWAFWSTAAGLVGQVALPLMLGAGPAHALAPELTLKPVLVELGATCPAQGLYHLDSTYPTDDSLPRWAGRWSRIVLDAAKTRTAR